MQPIPTQPWRTRCATRATVFGHSEEQWAVEGDDGTEITRTSGYFTPEDDQRIANLFALAPRMAHLIIELWNATHPQVPDAITDEWAEHNGPIAEAIIQDLNNSGLIGFLDDDTETATRLRVQASTVNSDRAMRLLTALKRALPTIAKHAPLDIVNECAAAIASAQPQEPETP